MTASVRRFQAKDVPEAEVIALINERGRVHGKGLPPMLSWWDIAAAMPMFPEKVVLARLRSMVRRRVIGAQCTCGCRGDYTTDPDFWEPAKPP